MRHKALQDSFKVCSVAKEFPRLSCGPVYDGPALQTQASACLPASLPCWVSSQSETSRHVSSSGMHASSQLCIAGLSGGIGCPGMASNDGLYLLKVMNHTGNSLLHPKNEVGACYGCGWQ